MTNRNPVIHTLLQFFVVVLVSVPLAIGFQVTGMLLMGWWISGTKGFIIGTLWIPTCLATGLFWKQFKDFRQAVPRGVMMGLITTGALLLLGWALLIAAGPMDGGI